MNVEQQFFYVDKSYKVLNAEQEFLVHPSTFAELPVTKASLQCSFSSDFHIKDYCLILDRITLTDTKEEEQLDFNDLQIPYSGAVLLGANLIKEYYLKGGKLACFSYQNVFELVFENGMLITTVDQSRAMQRIRKNIELGLRSLNKNRDLRCIKRFINSSFVGDYRPFLLDVMKIKYLKEIQSEYKMVKITTESAS